MIHRAAMMMDVTLDALKGDVHPVLADLRAREGEVVWVPALDGWLVLSHAACTEALRDAARFTVDDPRFSTAQVIGPSMLSLDGAEHRRHRQPFVQPFADRNLQAQLAPWIAERAGALLAQLLADGGGDLVADFAGQLAVETISQVLGLEVEPAVLLGWYRRIVDAVAGLTEGGPDASIPDALDGLARSIQTAARSETLSARIAFEADLTDTEFASNVAVVLFGAIETSEGMTANAIWHALSTPGAAWWRAPIFDAMAERIVEESLRLEPAATVVHRYVTQETVLAGQELAAGDFVSVSLAAANRDPAVFDRPDEFDPDRGWLRRQVAFVVGPHRCLGSQVARLQTRVALGAFVAVRDKIALVGEPVSPRGLIFRKPSALEFVTA